MKKRGFSGSCGVGVFIIAFVCVCVAFGTPSWLVSDRRITNAKFQKLGLWTHCFKSLPNPNEMDAPRRYFVGCRWVYDPFTAGYSEIRGFLLPPFMIATQFFYTLCFLLSLISFILILFFTLCSDSEQKRYVQLIAAIGCLLLVGGISGGIAVLIFASFGNAKDWMPGHDNNFFGWSFIIADVGTTLTVIAGVLFLIEAYVQRKKRQYLKESQTKIQLESHT